MAKGQVISGDFSNILIRQKSDENLEIGELLISEGSNSKILLQVFDLVYGSQISQQNLELISGLDLEENSEFEFMDKNLRNYMLAKLKTLVTIKKNKAGMAKTLPKIFSKVREITKNDLDFLSKPKSPLLLGNLRSGSKTLELDVHLNGKKALSHHILVAGTTGRGKSVLLSNLIWNLTGKEYAGILVLDPHDEYYGRNKPGMKDFNEKNKISYYTAKNPPPGEKTLKISIEKLKPQHFNGAVNFSDPQKQALNIYYKTFGNKWIESIILEKKPEGIQFRDDTLAVVKRKLLYLLDLDFINNTLSCRGVFSLSAGETTIAEICSDLEESKTVIIDSSSFSGAVEILIGSMITTEIFNKYKHYKIIGKLKEKPIINIILEEAPRVLGKEVLEKGSNIFSTIAREGRKFKVGLTAITQLPSLIPRQILANMNTKIILGIEMKPERQAIIESASQDLSADDRTIASLDIGEALITSNFLKFATPVKIPFFPEIVKKEIEKRKEIKNDFSGVSL